MLNEETQQTSEEILKWETPTLTIEKMGNTYSSFTAGTVENLTFFPAS